MKIQYVARRGASLLARSSGVTLALSLAFASAPSGADSLPVNGWGVPITDVTPDPSIRYGILPNGLKYAIMHNDTPRGAASVRLQIAFGSIAEKDNERGLAHFIEHMAFNGTTHVPEGDMVKILERQGLAFGPDTNAMTGFDTTTYLLDLPKADAEHVDTAMFLLREVASEVKFDPGAVDRERGVILGEERASDNFQLHQIVDILGFQVPKTPYPVRLPIGVDAVLKTASADTIKNLYHRYYRPENATLVFVGNSDPAAIEAKIKTAFAGWKDDGPAGAPLPRGTVDLARPESFDTFVDPAVATTVDYTVARPWSDKSDTLAERRKDIVEALATAMFNRRLQRLVNAPGSSLLYGAMLTQEDKDAALLTTVKIAAKDGDWKTAVDTTEQEVRRALSHGFTQAELKVEVEETVGTLRTAAEQEDTRTNSSVAATILGVVDEPKFVSTPRFKFDEFETVAKTLTPADIDAAFRRLWTGSPPLVHLSTKQDVAVKQVAAAFDSSRAVAVAAPKVVASQAFGYKSFGPPGKVVADERIPDLGVRTVRFANNVRLNIKKTDFEAGKVRFLVRLGDGTLDLPRSEPGLGTMMTITSATAGLKKNSVEELKELMAGKTVTLGTAVSDDAFVSSGATTATDLALQMKVSAAYLLDPGFRPEAASQWTNIVPVLEKQLDSQPQTVAQVRLPVVLANGDTRFGLPDEQILAKRNFAEARSALAPVIASAPIEITIVGDVNENSAIAAVASSFGAIGQRRLETTLPAGARKAEFRTDHAPIHLTHEGAADQALIAAAWPTDDDHDFKKVVGLELLKDVLDVMLTDNVREKLGDSYGVSVESTMSDAFTGFGYLAASAIVAPDKLDEVQSAIKEAATQLRDSPVSDDVLARARNPELESLDHALHNNGYWLKSLAKSQSEPQRLDRIRVHQALIKAVTAKDLQQLARTYLQPDKLQLARIVSTKAPKAAAK